MTVGTVGLLSDYRVYCRNIYCRVACRTVVVSDRGSDLLELSAEGRPIDPPQRSQAVHGCPVRSYCHWYGS